MHGSQECGGPGSERAAVIGINAAYVAAWASIPLVFSLQTAKKFNEVAVTTDVPEPADLNTMLEVGSWTSTRFA